ncbi:elongation factor G [candidate division NPL-UPA2 bacterium]|nr:elongation factor G [candidate division NPL-UPA2 bacterium]
MKTYKCEQLRDVAIIAHGGVGKTSLTEALLFTSGATKRLGRVDEGTTVSDYSPDEVRRKISIDSSLVHTEWREHKINIIDTPGYADFIGEMEASLRVVDAAIVLVSAVGGVEVGTERVWHHASEEGLPRVIFVNRMDEENANFYSTLEAMSKEWGRNAVPVQLPIGEGDGFQGIVDLAKMKAYLYGSDGKAEEKEIPGELESKAKEYGEKLVEAAAETDDILLEKYLEEGGLSEEEIRRGLRSGALAGKIFPVLCGSAYRCMGAEGLLGAIVDYLPSPLERPAICGKKPGGEEEERREPNRDAPFAALVFKTIFEPHLGVLSLFRVYSGSLSSGSTTYNANKGSGERIGQIILMLGKEREEVSEIQPGDLAAVAKLKETAIGDTLCDEKNPIILPAISFPKPMLSLAVEPRTKKDQEKLSAALAKIQGEDPTFEMRMDHELGQTIISGMGELHLEIIIDELRDKFGVEVDVKKSKVAYRETIRSSTKAQGKYKRQSGGRGQYGDAWLEVEPLPRGEDFEFVNKIVGGAIPAKYIPAVEKGVKEAMQKGILAGYPVTDVRVTLYDGTFHEVDSSDLAFHIAGSLAFKKAVSEAKPVLLEPIIEVEVIVPDEYLGDITGDLNSRRGRIMGIEVRGGRQFIKAQVPLAEMDRYSTELRSKTKGTGAHTMKFSHYEEVPQKVSERIIAEAEREREKER